MCALDVGCGVVGGKGLHWEDLDAEVPWDAVLTFRDAQTELDFREAQHKNWCSVDALAFFLCLVGNPCKMHSWNTPGLLGTCIHHGWLTIHMILHGALYLCYKRHKWPYNDHKVNLWM